MFELSVPNDNFKTIARAQLANAKNISQFAGRIESLLLRFKIANYMYICLDNEPTILFTNMPHKFGNWYDVFQNIANDYACLYAKTNTKPIFRSQLQNYQDGSKVQTQDMVNNRLFFDMCASHGYVDSFIIPISFNHRNVFIVTSKLMHIDQFYETIKENYDDLWQLGFSIDGLVSYKFPDLYNSHYKFKSKLHKRPLELLRLMALKDMTMKEASIEMEISVHTADKHMAALKKHFGVNTIAQVVLRAVKHDYIMLEEVPERLLSDVKI